MHNKAVEVHSGLLNDNKALESYTTVIYDLFKGQCKQGVDNFNISLKKVGDDLF